MADWSPVCIGYKEPDQQRADGTIVQGREFVQRGWRCALHDKQPPPPKRFDLTIDFYR